jgi:anti-sigma factor ChrR (cupin superfamily)
MKKTPNRNAAPGPDVLADSPLLLDAMLDQLAPQAMRPGAPERILARIDAQLPIPQVTSLRNSDGQWRRLADRVFMKVLVRDEDTQIASFLVRYEPGSRVEKHPQRGPEHCFLVSGDLKIGDFDMVPGDFQFVEAGIEHGPLVSQGGALVFVHGLLRNLPPVV